MCRTGRRHSMRPESRRDDMFAAVCAKSAWNMPSSLRDSRRSHEITLLLHTSRSAWARPHVDRSYGTFKEFFDLLILRLITGVGLKQLTGSSLFSSDDDGHFKGNVQGVKPPDHGDAEKAAIQIEPFDPDAPSTASV